MSKAGILIVESEICVPLFDLQQVVGALNVESTIGNPLIEADVQLISILSQQASIALGRARLVGELRRQAVELHVHDTDLDAFAHTVAHDFKSPPSIVVGFSELLPGKEYAEARFSSHCRSRRMVIDYDAHDQHIEATSNQVASAFCVHG